MSYPIFQGEEFAASDFDLLIRQLDTHPAVKQVNRNPRVNVVLAHLAVCLHEDQHNVKIRILDERFRAATAVAVPPVQVSEFPKFIGKIELEQWASQERQSCQ